MATFGVELVKAAAVEPASRAGEPEWPALRARRRRWAELLRLVFKVEVEVCPRCGGEAGIVGFVTAPQVVRRILAHQTQRGVEARAGPWAEVVALRRAVRGGEVRMWVTASASGRGRRRAVGKVCAVGA